MLRRTIPLGFLSRIAYRPESIELLEFPQMNTGSPLVCSSISLSLIAAVLFALPLRADAQPGRTNRRQAAETTGPQTYSSRNFVVHTDLKAEEAKDLLERLETMLGLISTYWGQQNRKTIECFVVKDLERWPNGSLPPDGLQSILGQAGVTVSEGITNGQQTIVNAKVYAVADRGTPQHEAVHAYCAQTFGTTGPLWYSEGMAEMGQYWKAGDSSVNADPIVIEYLRKTEPKSLNEIVNGQEFTGDSWQNYAWRWALCHLLANNANYQKRFRPLGLAFLTKKNTSFEAVYGSMADEIIFEYLLFLKQLEPGYRVDLCSWDWGAKARPVRNRLTTNSKINAKAGWQPTKANLEEGKSYEFTTEGTWQLIENGPELTADGDEAGRGKLVGIIFDDYELSEEFEIGAYGEFTAPAAGHLFVRCRDEWGALSDNEGRIEFKIREANPDATPLPDPREKVE